jgi:hypothetical protein
MATYDKTQIETLRQVDVLSLATEVYGAKLEKCTPRELAGACPCKGCTARRDGFHVNTELNRWRCYTCHPSGWYDAAELVVAVERVGFRQAAEKLLTGNAKKCDVASAHLSATSTPSPSYRQSWARTILEIAQDRLWSVAGEQARVYLKARGLLSPTWEVYGLGFGEWRDKQHDRWLPSIVIPWLSSNASHLAALRYRHIETDGKVKYRVYGNLADRLFGWQAITQPADVVILVEGEINAMSIYQELPADSIHVFSVGSQANRLSESVVAHVSTYRRVIVWMDEPDRAGAIAKMLPNAVAVDSASMGGDANELLQANQLSGFLVTL